jgi:hypothetical protein
MSNRGKLRRKVVLPVTVIRANGEERQLVHTLDITETSARLGGLSMMLDPGETIELQRGAVKAKFQVHWMGESTSMLAGQAGICGVDPGKSIWGIQLPADQPDIAIDAPQVRVGEKARASGQNPVYECSGVIMLRIPGSNYPIRVHLKNIHVAGLYVEALTTLPLNTLVTIEGNVEGIQFELAGVVGSSVAKVGMDIAFHKISPENNRKVLLVLQKLKQKAWDTEDVSFSLPSSHASKILQLVPQAEKENSCRAFLKACQTLSNELDRGTATQSESEFAELRNAFQELYGKLFTIEVQEHEYLVVGEPGI